MNLFHIDINFTWKILTIILLIGNLKYNTEDPKSSLIEDDNILDIFKYKYIKIGNELIKKEKKIMIL